MLPKIEVVSREIITFPAQLSGARGGCMALNRMRHADREIVFFRGVPQNTIQLGILSENNRLRGCRTILSPLDFNRSYDGRTVKGFEDPTYFSGGNNPFDEEHGFLCTATALKPGSDSNVSAWLAYASLDTNFNVTQVRHVITPEMVIDSGTAKRCDMVKEAELLRYYGSKADLLVEYTENAVPGRASSNIGLVRVVNGEISHISPFLTAKQDESNHVSPCGSPILLEERNTLVFFNRQRTINGKPTWGISYLVMDIGGSTVNDAYDGMLALPLSNTEIPEQGQSGAGQSILFGSCVTDLSGGQIEILAHVADKRPERIIVKVGA